MADRNKTPLARRGGHAASPSVSERGLKRPPSLTPVAQPSQKKHQKHDPGQSSIARDGHVDSVRVQPSAARAKVRQNSDGQTVDNVADNSAPKHATLQDSSTPITRGPAPGQGRGRLNQSDAADTGKIHLSTLADTFMQFTDHSGVVSAHSISHHQTKAQSNRTGSEYESVRSAFGGFPALKESRHTGMAKLATSVDRQKYLVNAENTKQEDIANRVTQELLKSVDDMVRAPRTDHVSREEFDKSKLRLIYLETQQKNSVKQSEIQSLEAAVGDLFSQSRSLQVQYKSIRDEVSTLVRSRDESHQALKKELEELKSELKILKSMKATQDSALTKTREHVAKMHTQATKALPQVERVQSIEKQQKDMMKSHEDLKKSLSEAVSKNTGFDQKLTECQGTVANLESEWTKVKNGLDTGHQPTDGCSRTSLPANVRQELDNVITRVNKLEDDAKAIERENNNRDRVIAERTKDDLDKIVKDVEVVKNNVGMLETGLTDLSKSVDGLETKFTDLSKSVGEAANAGPHDAPQSNSQFHPILPSTSTESDPAASVPSRQSQTLQDEQNGAENANAKLRAEPTDVRILTTHLRSVQVSVAMLEKVTQQHKQVMDNVTTDALAHKMIAQWNSLYLPAGNLAQNLRLHKDGLTRLEERVNGLQDAGAHVHESITRMQEEFMKLRGQVRVLEGGS